jgi:hypothetical protein
MPPRLYRLYAARADNHFRHKLCSRYIRRIMTGGNDDAAIGSEIANGKGQFGSRTELLKKPDMNILAGENTRVSSANNRELFRVS